MGRLVGATLWKRNGRWRSQIKLNNTKVHLGIFDTEVEAHNAYKIALYNFNENGVLPTHKSSSRYLGISFTKRNKKWKARFKFNGEWLYLGYFETEELAHEAYLKFEGSIHTGESF
jgi:hypothetical protein